MTEFSPTYVTFLLWKLDPVFRREPAEKRRAAVDEFLPLTEPQDGFEVRAYTTLGLKSASDFMMWIIAKNLDVVPAFTARIYRTTLGAHLSLAHSYVAVTKATQYARTHTPNFELARSKSKYVIIYPFTKTDEWYQLPFEQRKTMMEEHRKVGEKWPQVRLNTTYSFGLGDQDFMLAFECDEPKDFSDLVQALREAKGRIYTKEDVPFFVCQKMEAGEILRGVVGV